MLRGIEFSGGSAGLRIFTARYLTIEGCDVHDTGDVAIRANDSGPYEGLRILPTTSTTPTAPARACTSAATTTPASSPTASSTGNYVHHTNDRTVEQGDGIELKEGSYGNVIRDNVIHDTNYPAS